MEKSGFFNAMKVGDTWDRIYKAENFAEYFASFIGNGVFPNPATGLQVKETSKMQVIIKPGKAWINGFIYINTDDLALDIDVADGVLNRIDKVVLRYDVAKREIRAVVKKGEFNSKPTAPILTRNADMYELALADITISAGAIKISQADITDLRLNKNLCGIVHGTVDQVDTTAIFNQFQSWYSQTKNEYDKDINNWTKEKKEAFEEWYSTNTKEFSQEFEEWFKTIKNKLDGDIAGNLLNSIKENTKKIEQVNSQYEDFTKQKGQKNGIAELDGEGKVKKEQLPPIESILKKIAVIKIKNKEEETNKIEIENIPDCLKYSIYILLKSESSIDITFNNDNYYQNHKYFQSYGSYTLYDYLSFSNVINFSLDLVKSHNGWSGESKNVSYKDSFINKITITKGNDYKFETGTKIILLGVKIDE